MKRLLPAFLLIASAASAQMRAVPETPSALLARFGMPSVFAAPLDAGVVPLIAPAALTAVPSAVLDGGFSAPNVPVDAFSAAPSSPENFARRARELFAEVRRAETGPRAEGAPATDDEMQDRMGRIPSTNPEREKFMIDLFKLAGARPEEIVVQDVGRGRHNIMVVKQGRTDRVIVVGGHHDKVSAGAGVIDNGTGATMVANLYQALRDADTEATIVFIAFGREEEGLIGSERYVASLSRDQRAKVDAMVNLDTLAVNGTYSWKNNSTRALLDRVRDVAAASSRNLTEAYLYGGDADSSSFRSAGIPAITLFGASEDVIFDIIHSGRDTMAAFSLEHYRNAYLLALELMKSLDRTKLGRVAV